MNPLLLLEIQDGGRLQISVRDNDGVLVPIDQKEKVINTAAVGRLCYVGVPTVFEITNYHFCDDYDVRTPNGTISLNESTITYTPAVIGPGGFYVNQTWVPITVEDTAPYTPAMTYPAPDQADLLNETTLIASNYAAPTPGMSHTATQWQVATDPGFVNLVVDITSTTSLHELTVSNLTALVWYYVRVRYIGELIY